MDTFAYLHLIQDYEDAETPPVLEHFNALKSIHLCNPAKLGLMGVLFGVCGVAFASPAQATDDEAVRASYAGGGYYYIFSGAVPGTPSSANPLPAYPVCEPDCQQPVQPVCTTDCPSPQPISVEPAPSYPACEPDCQTPQPVCTPDCPTGYTPISPGGVLKYGSAGPEVRALQIALHELGCYDGPVDGVFGKGTHHAVVRFQRDHGLIPDGIVGSSTAQILRLV